MLRLETGLNRPMKMKDGKILMGVQAMCDVVHPAAAV